MDWFLKDSGLKFIKAIKTVWISFELYLINVFRGNAVYFLICLLSFHVEVLIPAPYPLPSFFFIKNLPANARDTKDMGSIPELGRSPGVRNGNPFQYSCLENSMDRGVWWAIVHGATKSQTQLNDWTYTHPQCLRWRRKLQTIPIFLPVKFHGQKSLAGCNPWGHKELERQSNWACMYTECLRCEYEKDF